MQISLYSFTFNTTNTLAHYRFQGVTPLVHAVCWSYLVCVNVIVINTENCATCRMKLAASLLLLSFLTLSYADELSDCKCWEGYQPKKDDSGVQCYGILLLVTQPCNVPERPKCKCSGKVTGILSDAKGMWCSEYADGKQARKWACENKEEWDKFFKEYPKEKQ